MDLVDLEIEEDKAVLVVLEGDMAVVDGIEILVLGDLPDGIEILVLGGLLDRETIGKEDQVAIGVRRVPVEHTDDITFRFHIGVVRGLTEILKT
tara:strand:- start:1038 stop:1319 length:282 start_codon:yes stop_codon:yes gene_type:complete